MGDGRFTRSSSFGASCFMLSLCLGPRDYSLLRRHCVSSCFFPRLKSVLPCLTLTGQIRRTPRLQKDAGLLFPLHSKSPAVKSSFPGMWYKLLQLVVVPWCSEKDAWSRMLVHRSCCSRQIERGLADSCAFAFRWTNFSFILYLFKHWFLQIGSYIIALICLQL